jgi:hypothetical protein
LYDLKDRNNEIVSVVAELYRGQFIIPYVILTETAYLFRRAGETPAVIRFLDALVKANYQFEIVFQEDLIRARDIMIEYADAT